MQKTVPVFFILLFSLSLILFTACGKGSPGSGSSSCNGVEPAVDSPALLNFAKTHGITSLKDTAGLYYQVIDQGTGARPTLSSTIFVKYTATLMDSTIVDSTTNPARTGFTLGGLISGWQIGLPEIQAGGRIKLLIPSKYAYGCQGSGPIPPNTPMFFDITLVSIQ
jgi:FKBP-type peptidyl-prolyl cis-trans isomerase FkpA